MKNFHKNLASLCLLLTAGNACFGFDAGLGPNGKSMFHWGEWSAVSDENLALMRGGFSVGSGLAVSFGIIRTISINGDLVSRTSFNLPNLSKITQEEARVASTAIANAGIIQNGAGNIVESVANANPQLNASTVIQNTLSNQKIVSNTVINTDVNSLGIINKINSQNMLKDALLGSLFSR